jgi:hypothetical protein
MSYSLQLQSDALPTELRPEDLLEACAFDSL